jgi:TolA-binding protein
MFAKNIYTSLQKKCSNSNTWLILVAIVLMVSLSSCSLSRSPRGKNRQVQRVKVDQQAQKSTTQKDDLAEQNDIYKELEEYEKKIKTNKVSPKQNKPNRLPTLREQMASLNEKQVAIDGKVDDLQTDVDEMKIILQELKTTVEYIDSKLDNQPIKGPKDQPVSITRTKQNQDDIILPETKKTKKAQPKVKSTKKKAEEPDYIIKSTNTIAKAESKPVSMIETMPEADKMDEVLDAFVEVVNNDLDSRRYHQAIEKLTEKLSQEKETIIIVNYTFLLGESYFGLKDYNKAIENYAKVVRTAEHEKQDNAQVRIAECYMRTGRSGEAKEAYRVLIVKYPTSEYVPEARKMLQQL